MEPEAYDGDSDVLTLQEMANQDRAMYDNNEVSLADVVGVVLAPRRPTRNMLRQASDPR